MLMSGQQIERTSGVHPQNSSPCSHSILMGGRLTKRGALTSSRAFKAAGVRAPTSGNAAEWADWQLNPARSPTGAQPERAASPLCCSQRGLFA